MSLNYQHRGLAEGAYEAFPKLIRNIHHDVLPWWLMGAGLPGVTLGTIPVLIERIALLMPDHLAEVAKALKEDPAIAMSVEDVLGKYFQGFTANIGYETNAQWSKRIFKAKTISKAGIYAELREFEKPPKALAAK